jgi:hypothetical protein
VVTVAEAAVDAVAEIGETTMAVAGVVGVDVAEMETTVVATRGTAMATPHRHSGRFACPRVRRN